MRKITEYLDSKANRFPPESILDIRPYATIAEISSLLAQNRIQCGMPSRWFCVFWEKSGYMKTVRKDEGSTALGDSLQ
jgi:hypothetical protein